MLSRAVHLLRHLVWYQPVGTLIGLVFLCAVGIVAATGTSVLARQWRKTRVLEMRGVLPGLALLLFSLADGALLRALPWLRLSFSTEILPPLAASVTVRLLALWGLTATSLVVHWRARRRRAQVDRRALFAVFLAVNLAFSAMQVYAYVVEPLWVETSEISLAFDDLDPGLPPVRIVHLSDTHIERSSYREATIAGRVNALQPDIIVLTGDYLNLSRLDDPVSAEDFRQFVSQLHAPYGIYAVRGSVEPTTAAMASLIARTDVVWLEQRAIALDVRGQRVTLAGVACSHRRAVDAVRLEQAIGAIADDAFTVLLYHSPDLIAEAVEHHVDLYLGGHTHGGQLRLPFYGAIVTGSIYGKRYEAGLFAESATRMVISRGIGFEGGGMPRARFLSRPEIVSLELGGASSPPT